MKFSLLLLFIIAFFSYPALSQARISSGDASRHIGERVSIAGKIYSAKVFTRPQQTILYMGGNYPNQHLTLVINQDERKNFSVKTEDYLLNKRVNVTGRLIDVDGRTEMVVNDITEIRSEENSGEFEVKPMDVSGFSRFFDEE